MADLLIAPYIPLKNRVTVGPWELVPFRDLDDAGVVPDDLGRPVSRLIEAYQVPGTGGSTLGAVIFPEGTEVGEPFERSDMQPLGHALVAGVLANNPVMTETDEESRLNAGHGMATAENAVLHGHPLGDGNSYVIATGTLSRVLAYRTADADEPLPKLQPPIELPTPLWADFDVDVADAAQSLLVKDDEVGRRLSRTLDWYRIALSNAGAVTPDVRVGAARSALEVLTDSGDSTQKLVRAYGRLVRIDETTESTYGGEEVFWARGPVQLTPDEWWLHRLSVLRNAIVHGDEIPDELWRHDGRPQLDQVHDRLIAALRIFIANNVGDPLLRLRLADRGHGRRVQEMMDLLAASELGDESEDSTQESNSNE